MCLACGLPFAMAPLFFTPPLLPLGLLSFPFCDLDVLLCLSRVASVMSDDILARKKGVIRQTSDFEGRVSG